jgi:hypothetical protein
MNWSVVTRTGARGALAFALVAPALAIEPLVLNSALLRGARVEVAVTVPPGFRHVVLEGSAALPARERQALVATLLDGGDAIVTFRVPLDRQATFLTLRAGPEPAVPPTEYSGPGFVSVTYLNDVPLTAGERADHVLNRVAYGPSPQDVAWVNTVGVGPYLGLQLRPDQIDEDSNGRLRQAEAALFRSEPPHEDTTLVRVGQVWRYFKGTQAPPANWNRPGFDDPDP